MGSRAGLTIYFLFWVNLLTLTCRAQNTTSKGIENDLYAGSYEMGDKGFIALAPLDEEEDRLMFTEFTSGRTCLLRHQSGTTFYCGPGLRAERPIDLTVTFIKNAQNEVTGLTLNRSGRPQIAATKNPHRQQEVSFRNEAITLSGRLLLPAKKGPHPALVVIHGSGPSTHRMGYMPYFYLRHGIAVLTYDKRGSGDSTGDGEAAGIEDLAGDAMAAVKLLRAHPDINPRQIGVRGDSQGGWVAPVVASRLQDVAFVIVRSGSGLPVYENLVYEIENEAINRGFSAQEAKKVAEVRRLFNRALITNAGWDKLIETLQQSSHERWLDLSQARWVLFRGAPDSDLLEDLRHYFIFDPAPAWEHVTCPVLVLLAELDRSVPSRESAAKIEKALLKAGNKDFTIKLFPKANHGLLEAETGYQTDGPRLNRFVPGYLDSMINWLLSRVSVKND